MEDVTRMVCNLLGSCERGKVKGEANYNFKHGGGRGGMVGNVLCVSWKDVREVAGS